MARPKLLLLDEPSLGLAPQIIGQIGEVIREINRQGTSVLLVEQNATMALAVADSAFVLDVGRCRCPGPAAELARADAVQRLYLGHGADEATHAAGRGPPTPEAVEVDRVSATPRGRRPRGRADLTVEDVTVRVRRRPRPLRGLVPVSSPAPCTRSSGPTAPASRRCSTSCPASTGPSSGRGPLRRRRAHRTAALPDRPARRRPRLPEHRAVGDADGRREPHARPARPDQGRLPRLRAAAAAGDPRGQAARGAGPRDRRVPRAGRQARHARSASSPTATRSGSRWPARCAPSRDCCCSTSRSPA